MARVHLLWLVARCCPVSATSKEGKECRSEARLHVGCLNIVTDSSQWINRAVSSALKCEGLLLPEASSGLCFAWGKGVRSYSFPHQQTDDS